MPETQELGRRRIAKPKGVVERDQAGEAIATGSTTIDNKPLVLDLVELIAGGARPYAEVTDAWRTSGPRLPVWEDAVDLGFVVRVHRDGAGTMVDVTAAGRAFLIAEGRTRGNKDCTDFTEG